MASYNITVNENVALGRSILTILHSVPQAVTFEMPKKKEAKKSEMYHRLDRAFADVRLMMDGKKKGKTLDELIDELDELRNGSH